MALHAKKKKISKIDKILISIFSITGIIFLLSWSWLLLHNPFISCKAEFFIKQHLSRFFVASESIEESGSSSQTDDTQDSSFLGPEGSIENDSQFSESSESGEDLKKEDRKPAIRLQIFEGPVYSASDDSCSYIIIAIVTGKPLPSVQFSKDESNGSLGENKAKISLKRNMRTYTLTATASNYLGTVMDSITLNWGCKSSPQISEIRLSSDVVYVNSQYEIATVASDPDGGALTYKWSVSGGSLEDDSLQAVKWNTPTKSGDYEVKVIVRNSSGADAAKTISVYVGDVKAPETTQSTSPPATTATAPATEPPPTTTTEPQQDNFNLTKKTDEGGYLEYGGETYAGGNVYAGDSDNNRPCMGFISFDTTGLSGKTVLSASLAFSGAAVHDNPLSYLDSLWINIVEWGAEPIVQSDFNLVGVAVQSFTNPSITCSSEILKSELQKAINAGKSRFQVRVHFSGPYTDNDNKKDGWEYTQANINLNVTVR